MTMDWVSIRAGLSGPGADTRQWVSYGVVDDDQQDQKSVTFDPDHGPLVAVTLQPSGIPVHCRVGGHAAGNGEAEYFPFVSGDEVMVAIPQGDERSAPLIISRCNNQIDRHPTTVGGQDVTKNTVAFRRIRTPYVFEVGDSYLVRAATAGNFLLLEKSGATVLADGFKDFLHIGPDFVGFQASDADGAPTMLLQLDKTNGLLTLETTGKGKLTMSLTGEGAWYSTSTISFGAGGMVASEHVATVEGLANFLAALLTGLAAFSAPGALSALATPVVSQGVVAAAAALAGSSPLTPVVLSALQTALSTKLQNTTGLLPNIGSPGFLAG